MHILRRNWTTATNREKEGEFKADVSQPKQLDARRAPTRREQAELPGRLPQAAEKGQHLTHISCAFLIAPAEYFFGDVGRWARFKGASEGCRPYELRWRRRSRERFVK